MKRTDKVKLTADEIRWFAADMKRTADKLLSWADELEDASEPSKVIATLPFAKRLHDYCKVKADGEMVEMEAIEWQLTVVNRSTEVTE